MLAPYTLANGFEMNERYATPAYIYKKEREISPTPSKIT